MSLSASEKLASLLAAVKFAAHKHAGQQRKDGKTPYINHPIEVAEMLSGVGGVGAHEVLIAALLHDTVEDTDTSRQEIEQLFGEEVASLVLECTDDKSLPKPERKRLQIEHAPHKTDSAKLIKLADKISNVKDLAQNPPADWSSERKLEYLNWSEKVVQGLRGQNQALDELYDSTLSLARTRINAGHWS